MVNYQRRKYPGTINKYWPTLFRALLFCALCAAALAISSGLMANEKRWWQQISAVLTAVILSLLLTKTFARWERIKIIDIGFALNKKSISRFFTGLGVGLLLAVLQSTLVLITGHIKLITVPGVAFSTILKSFILYLAISLREEISFRGFPLFSLQRANGPGFALLIVGIIFIAEHKIGGMDWSSAIFGSGVGSILFGLAAIKTKGLALPIGLHCAWNFGQWLMGFKNEPGILKVVIDKGYEGRIEIVGWISYLLIMSIAISGFFKFTKMKEKDLIE